MDTFESMRAFVRVADLGGFAAAARALDLSPAMVTKHVAHLEARLGVRLLHRTTRKLSLTEAGRIYHERCVELLHGLEDAERDAAALSSEPRGLLRVTAPVEFGNMHVAPLVADFLKAHPEVSVSLELTNRMVDLVHEGVDLAIRVVASLEASYVARRLATTTLLLVAAPSYLAGHGEPAAPEALAEHEVLCFAEPRVRDELAFRRDADVVRVRVRPRMQSNSAEALLVAARAGAGIFMLPSFLVAEELASGSLRAVLDRFPLGELGVYAVYANRRNLPAKLRAFLDQLRAAYGERPQRDPWYTPVAAAPLG